MGEMLGAKPRQIFTAKLGQSIREVVEAMKQHGISQLPVLDNDRIVGIVNESTVLTRLLDQGNSNDPIDQLIETNFAIVETTNRLSMVGQFFRQNKVVLVVDNRKLVGIITKIDYIDHVSHKI